MEMVKMSSCCCIAFFLILLYKCKADSYSSRFDEINIPPFSTEYEERKGYMVQYRPGDILIGGLMRVHRRGNEEHCSEIQDDGIQAVETMNMVVDMINANPSILNGIKLGTVMVDTCDVDTHALERAVTVLLPFFFGNDDKANKPPLFTGVVGAASSAVSIQTAGFLQIFKIPQVSMWSTNPTLSSKARFPYFFRTVPSDSYQATAMLALIQKMKWNYISVVYEDDFYGGQGYAEIKEATEKLQICIAAAIAIPRHTTKETFVEIVHQLLQKKRAKAVIVFTKLHDAEKLISAANDNPNARGHFFWIGSDGWSGQVPTGDGGNYLESLDGAIAFSPRTSPIALLDTYMANLTLGQHLSGKDEEERFRNPWFPEYLSETLKCRLKGTNGTGINGRRRKLCRKNDHIDRKKFVALSKMQNVADAVLSIVYSLDVFWKEACGGKGLCDALNQTVQTNWLADQVSGIMKNISFTAINGGMFKFDENLDGPAEYNIKRFNKTLMTATDLRKWTVSGVFHDNEIEWNTSSLPVDNVNSVCSEPCKIGQARIAKASTCCWTCQTCHERQFVRNGTSCSFCPNGSQPTETRDGCIEIETSFTQFDDIHSIVSMVIAVFGIVLTLIIAFVFHTHRNTAIVKASGKELCIFVFIGALLCFANSFVLSVPASLATCFVSRLLICLGPTLMYAALITKTIRVVIIFRTKKILSPHVKKFLLPKYQIMVTFIFVFIQLCVLSVWLGFGYPSTTTIYPDVSTAFRTCTDTEGLVVLVALAYPFLLIVACTVLATVNRNVPTGFNETQYIGFTMYATCVIWFAFLPIFITSSQKLRLKVATLAICVSLSAITVLACLFGYRCYVIMFKPDENTSHSVMSPLESSKASTSQIGRRSAATNEQPQSEATLTPSPISKCETLELSKNEKKKIKFLEPLSPADSYSSRFDEINIPPFSTEYEERKGYMVQYRPGDILIGGLMRVHRRGNEEHCSEIQDDGIQAVETMNMVVDMINANPSILNGIKLGTVMVDTCDVDTHALERAVTVLLPFFFGNDDNANKPPLFTGVVGAASSAVSIQTAGFLQIFKIPQVSMWSTNPTLSSKARFPYFFRTVPSDSYQATAMLALIQKIKWNYISVVYEDDFYGGQGYAEIKEATEKLQICIAAAIAIPRHTTKETFVEIVHQLLQKKRAKAVIVFTKLHDAEKLISAANDNPNARGHFFWIGSDGWSGQVPTGDGGNYLESLDGAIAFSPRTSPIALLDTYMANLTLGQHLSGKDEEERFRNPWFPEYLSETLKCRLKGTNGTGINGRRRKLCRKNDHIDRKKFVALSKMQNVADAVLSIVYSLDVFWKEACGCKGLCDALNQTVQTNWLADQVSGIMKNISFTAINGGMFKFDENLDGPAEYNIKRFNKTLMTATDLRKWTVSGVFHDNEIEWNTSSLPVDNVNSVCSEPCKIGQARIAKASTCCWTCQTCHERQFVRNGTSCSFCPNGSQPTETRDGCIEIETSFTQFDDIHSIVSMVIAVFGIVLTLIIAFVFHTHRNTAIVKASGKELCIFVFIGALLCFANSFVLSVPASLATCFVSRLLICLGPTLMYAALITKTIRVVIIFRTKKILSPHVKKFLLPKYQIMVTFIFVFIQLCVLSVWLGFGYPSTTTIYPDVSTAFRTCTDTEGLVVLVALAYPFLLIVACTVLATVNRNVPTGFNETQYIGFTMYATCVIWFAFLPIFITSSQKLRLKVATLAICVSLSAITVLACLFGYRCYVIMFKPDENTSHSVMSPLESSKASTSQIGRRSAATNEQPQSEATLTPSPISKCETLELSKNEKKKIKFLEPLSPEIEHCIAIAGGKQSQGGAKEMKKKAT